MDALQDKEHGVIENTDEIAAIGHRVLHGGTIYSDSCVVNEDVKRVVSATAGRIRFICLNTQSKCIGIIYTNYHIAKYQASSIKNWHRRFQIDSSAGWKGQV
mgnify:CR=1 FL=1